MAARIIDGKALAAGIRQEIAAKILVYKESLGKVPGLATVIVGDNPASHIYVANKIRACEETGIATYDFKLPASAPEAELLGLIGSLSGNPDVHGILVQLPLPKQISFDSVFKLLPQAKDVDGFGLANWSWFFKAKNWDELSGVFIPCTPLGVLEMIDSIGFNCQGKLAVVLGRSNIVGKPMTHLLTIKNATVIQCHSQTQNIEELTQKAQLVVVAMGKPNFLKANHIQEGACVIDVGINRLADGALAGDCDTEAIKKKAAFVSPVPGGVGPMTIAMLLRNTLKAFAKIEKVE